MLSASSQTPNGPQPSQEQHHRHEQLTAARDHGDRLAPHADAAATKAALALRIVGAAVSVGDQRPGSDRGDRTIASRLPMTLCPLSSGEEAASARCSEN